MAIALLVIRSRAWLDLPPLQIQGNILILGPDLNSERNITECVNKLEGTSRTKLSNLTCVRQTSQERLRILWCDGRSLDGVRVSTQMNNWRFTCTEAQTLSTFRQNERKQICHFVFRVGHGDALSWSNLLLNDWWSFIHFVGRFAEKLRTLLPVNGIC